MVFGLSPLHAAKTAVEDYDSLSQFSSDDLMESGRRFFEQRVGSKALACFYIVSERYATSKDSEAVRLSIRAMNNCGCVYKFLYYDYLQAYEYFIRAYDLCEQTDYDEFMPIVMVNLGDLLNDYSARYASQSLAQQARQLFEQCLEQATERKNWELMTTAFFNLSNQNYDLDLKKYEVIFSDEVPDSTPDLTYVRLQYQGIHHIQQGNYVDARECFLRQLGAVTARWEPERDTLSTYMSIAHTYRLEHNYPLAVEYLEKAFQKSEQNSVDDQAIGICEQLAELYALMGDSRQQQHYHLLYLELKDKTIDNRLSSIGELNYIHELRKEEQRARELSLRQQRQQTALIAGGTVLLVVLLMAFLLWRKNRELSARNKSLFEMTQQVMKVEAEEQQLRRSSRQSDEHRESLIQRILEILENPEMICQQDFTVARMAKLAESNTTYVSQAINEKFGVAFSNVLGSYRIREACRRMNDTEHYGNQTIESISEGVGFKSRTAFSNAFKRETGLTPSEYLRMANSQ